MKREIKFRGKRYDNNELLLLQHPSETPTKWREEAEHRRANKNAIRKMKMKQIKAITKITKL